MTPSYADLRYFVEVSASANLSRAAERLGISQPSLSVAIQRLEDSVGVPLLIRSKRGVTLTQAGKQLLLQARDLLQRWDSVKARAIASTTAIEGTYSLGAHPSVALYSLPAVLPSLLERYPRLEIRLQHDLSRKIAESVVRMETDVGIVINAVRHRDLVIRKLCDDEVGFWSGPGNRKTQDFRSGSAVLLCDPELAQTQTLLKKLRAGGVRYSRIIPSSNLELITELTRSGAGIGVLPGRVAARAGRGLHRLPGAPAFRDELSVLYRVENRGVKAIQAIVGAIESAFAQD